MSIVDQIDVFTQNSIRIRGKDKTIYIDPFQMKEAPHDADIVMVTHDHYDHFSPDDIVKVASDDTVFVLPAAMEQKASKVPVKFSRVFAVEPGGSYELDGLEFETVAAYNILKPFHPKSAGWVGYILKMEDKRIYIAGDTDATREAKEVKCDIALVPIGGTYTMDPSKAADFINTIAPEVAIPTHFGNAVGKPGDADDFAGRVNASVKVVNKIVF